MSTKCEFPEPCHDDMGEECDSCKRRRAAVEWVREGIGDLGMVWSQFFVQACLDEIDHGTAKID